MNGRSTARASIASISRVAKDLEVMGRLVACSQSERKRRLKGMPISLVDIDSAGRAAHAKGGEETQLSRAPYHRWQSDDICFEPPTHCILEVRGRGPIDSQQDLNQSSENHFVKFFASGLEILFRDLRASRRQDMSNQIAG
jgi:hypothetical protein